MTEVTIFAATSKKGGVSEMKIGDINVPIRGGFLPYGTIQKIVLKVDEQKINEFSNEKVFFEPNKIIPDFLLDPEIPWLSFKLFKISDAQDIFSFLSTKSKYNRFYDDFCSFYDSATATNPEIKLKKVDSIISPKRRKIKTRRTRRIQQEHHLFYKGHDT